MGNIATRVWLGQALSQGARVALQPATVTGDELQVPDNLVPNRFPCADIPTRLFTQQATEIEMTDDPRLESLQHLELLVVVALIELLLGAAGGVHGFPVIGGVVVDGDGVDVVDGAEEVVHAQLGGETRDVGPVGRAQPLALKTDEDMDLRGISGLQASSFLEVGLVSRGQFRQRLLRVVQLQHDQSAVDTKRQGRRGPGAELASSGYRSSKSKRGICSVRPIVL